MKLAMKVAGTLTIVAMAMGGIYALAATIAATIASSASVGLGSGHAEHVARTSDRDSAIKRSSAERRASRAKCKQFTRAERDECNVHALRHEARAVKIKHAAKASTPSAARPIP